MAASRQARAAQDILTILGRLADGGGECRGEAVITAIAREMRLSTEKVRAYLGALKSIGVIDLTMVKEVNPPQGQNHRPVPRIRILKRNAVIVMRGGYLVAEAE